MSFLVPPSVRHRWQQQQQQRQQQQRDDDDDYNDDDEQVDVDLGLELGGETLAAVDARRRVALEERRRTLERRRRVDEQPDYSDRRLSRDLEEGFMDSSDDEDAGEIEGRGDRPTTERWRNT
jgi:hypothetical protein